MSREASQRRRLATGLTAALVVGVGLCQWSLVRARADASREQRERSAIVALRALTEIAERAGSAGDALRRAVAAWAREDRALVKTRVVLLDGLSLEASTDPADVGDKAAPRRLARDEKPLYDQTQRLRAAVETNRQEGGARKEEIEVAPTGSGGLALAAPLEKDGTVVGMVAVETAPLPPASRAGWLFPILAAILGLAAFAGAAAVIGERRGVLAIAACLVLLVVMAVVARYAGGVVAADVRAGEGALAAAVTAEKGRATKVLEQGALGGGPLHVETWDSDLFRRPLGVVRPDGGVDETKLGRELAASAASTARATVVYAVVALGVLALVGFGVVARLGATLRRHRQAYAYTFPALFGMLLLVFLPFLYGVVISFSDMSLYSSQAPLGDLFTKLWVGLKNFTDILGDFHVARHSASGLVWNYQNIYWTLAITVIWTVTNVAYGVGMGLFLALILNTKGLLARPIYRVIFILPWATPNYITALTWRGMFHRQFGVFNQMIQMFGGTPVSWFENTWTSLFACIATNAWLSVPFMMVISLGALQSISADLYEAARVDGATRWQQFRSITLPSLKPALVPAVILSVIWTFNMFNIIYLVSGGEPGHSTEILITQAYKFAFEQYRYGYAAAYSMVIFAVLLAYGLWQNKVTKATEGI